MLVSIRAFTLLLPLLAPLVPAQADDLECDDNDLATYLLSVIDSAYDSGLTIFEQYIAALSEKETGYTYLESLHESNNVNTLLAPTDEAFNKAGISPPFNSLSEQELVDLIEFHTLEQDWTYINLPQSPDHAIASTLLNIKNHLNSTVDSTATAAMILQQGDGGNVAVRLAVGNGTTWKAPLNLDWAGITNLKVLPINTVLPYPPKLSAALTLPTSSRSVNGTKAFAAAVQAGFGPNALNGLTKEGFTVFVPVDDAFTSHVQAALVSNPAMAQTALKDHYTTSFSLFSGFWNGQAASHSYTIRAQSGVNLTVTHAENGTTVKTSQGVSATVLRSDIPLENGVMHLIDSVLFNPLQAPTTISSISSATSEARPSGSAGSPASSAGSAGQSGAACNIVHSGMTLLAGILTAGVFGH
ncbi:hypothetical protein BD324DRAFT_608003 [Kockovaella imperatae]|uniref:FAS1 domain-containing protein n=1 Tax=Kockovaella imperatae TaxID=4999 RepID=A0A1Y1UM48_9TREE|nr:hypothetical protein BD324DRAFT_608003 [Kockovaella imperatae]ORX38564.1 hypothetical protein BD324DRAFT_608003 [Kockovaella imperatae]